MKISENLPQFQKRTTLFAITSQHKAEFLLAKDGEIILLGSFKVSKPHYSDREDFFLREGYLFESSAKFELMRKTMRQEFLRGFRKNLKNIAEKNNIKEVFLYAPSAVAPGLEKIIKKYQKLKVRNTIHGNYFQEHPFEILKKRWL